MFMPTEVKGFAVSSVKRKKERFDLKKGKREGSVILIFKQPIGREDLDGFGDYPIGVGVGAGAGCATDFPTSKMKRNNDGFGV
ncbi:hypothetical protein L2E82_44838 [Cichorium intybus]|uniref:Uncharacterized protein n=1 Tax=Cichorium intybus TaxID=13427 RepID=A0ACB8ZQX6_CICIN|nr:hypothetical protein L2E82_44838 [Cichorium intybus]